MAVSTDFQNTLDHAWQVGDYAYGRELIEKALLRDPQDAYLRVCHITALGHCSRFQSARDETARLFSSIPQSERVKWSAELAAMWAGVGRHDLALPLALEAGGAADAAVELMEITVACLERLGRLDEALDMAGRGMRHHPGHAGLLCVKARILRRQNRHEEAARALQGIMPSQLAADEVKIRIGYELGHVREAQGRHSQAYQEFCKAKFIQMRQSRDISAKWQKHMDALENHGNLPTRDDFRQWHDEATATAQTEPRLAFLTGCPRSGTTLLERMLDAHEGVATTPETNTLHAEVWIPLSHALSRQSAAAGLLEKLRMLTREQLDHARRNYLALVPDALEQAVAGRMIVDKNPSLFSSLPTVARLFPQSPLLVALRDPRAIAWSCFTQYLPVNIESVAFLSLETTCRHIAARLENWIELRGRLTSPWHETRYETLVRDPAGESRSILEFLGLPWNGQVLHHHESGSHVRSPSYAQVSRPIYQESVGKWRHYQGQLDKHLPVLQTAMKELG